MSGEPGSKSASIPVVALGGSAGALTAFEAFFRSLPPDSGAAFVVIQHSLPARESQLPKILAHDTGMPVVQAQDGMPVEAGSVYVAPPDYYLGLQQGGCALANRWMRPALR